MREQPTGLAEASVQQIVAQVDARLAHHTQQQHENMAKELETIRRNLARSQTPADVFESYAKEQQAYIAKEMAELRASAPFRGTPQVKVAEEMVEVLEDNQVQLENLLVSKYIGFFQTQVGSWSKKLSTADQVIEIWSEVQRTWTNLESLSGRRSSARSCPRTPSA